MLKFGVGHAKSVYIFIKLVSNNVQTQKRKLTNVTKWNIIDFFLTVKLVLYKDLTEPGRLKISYGGCLTITCTRFTKSQNCNFCFRVFDRKTLSSRKYILTAVLVKGDAPATKFLMPNTSGNRSLNVSRIGF